MGQRLKCVANTVRFLRENIEVNDHDGNSEESWFFNL